MSVKKSTGGINYTDLADQETETDNIFEYNLDGATYFEISNASSTNALYPTSVSIDLIDF